ncbi:hypothetical protein IEQ34_019503 [Dendrobium chrysotoxum]|uniref:Uncharacterized protein n=1 Tax=Dendrobium chrysotoxum TaxID=161865 RepID=A0AAV7FRL4_DENCH|nr:hypothetical protein IEQ34_019503 [Dendrobium chrysotoxum]
MIPELDISWKCSKASWKQPELEQAPIMMVHVTAVRSMVSRKSLESNGLARTRQSWEVWLFKAIAQCPYASKGIRSQVKLNRFSFSFSFSSVFLHGEFHDCTEEARKGMPT